VAVSTRVPVAVLGAGLTGLSAAVHLRRAGVTCRVLERASRPGGLAVTTEERGYRFDRTGHLLHLEDEGIRALALGFIGDDFDVIERRSAIWSHGVYTRYPFQANTHGLPPEVAYACVMGFIEARERRRAEPPAIENFADYCRAYFGEGISKHFMIPYNSRVWGVPPTEISAAWCERFVPRPELEDVIAGAVGLSRRELGYNARFIYPHQGIGVLADGMAAELGATGSAVELGREPVRIEARERVIDLGDERLSYERLISTIPLPALVSLIADAPEQVRAAAERLRVTPLWYLDVALRTPCEKPYHWIYVPEEKYPFYRVGCYAHFSEQMAPPGKSSLYVELVDRDEPDLDELLPRVADALVEMGLIRSREAIVFARARHIASAYVIFDEHHEPALAVIAPYLASVGITSTGRYGGWNYSSMGDALAFGRDAARLVTTESA
jgi:protoporphyrinogen oxidase